MKEEDIWKNDHFWEAAFFETVAEEHLCLPMDVRQSDRIWDDMSEKERKRVTEMEEQIVFQVLGSFGTVSMVFLSWSLSYDQFGSLFKRFETFSRANVSLEPHAR